MSKKNVFLILLIVSFLTIMAISVWGKKPELSNRIVVSNVYLLDENNEEITKTAASPLEEKLIEKPYSEKIDYYTFSVCIEPDNATDLSLTYEILSGADFIDVKELPFADWKYIRDNETDEEKPNYHYFSVRIYSQETFTICFNTNTTDTVKKAYLKFVWTGTKHSDVIDI